MVLRWAAGAFLAMEPSFRSIDRYLDLWMLRTAMDETVPAGQEVRGAKRRDRERAAELSPELGT